MEISQHTTHPAAVRDWFASHTYKHDQFAEVERLAERKRQLGLTLTVVLPAREVATTIGPIVEQINELNEVAPIADQIAVIDAGSQDGTAGIAAGLGAEVYAEDELMPQFGPAIGKGDAMWRALSIARGDLVAYLDSDISDFGRHFVCGLLGPLLAERSLRFAKATYSRPFRTPGGEFVDDAGRVTELTAKPLFNMFYPDLCGFGQPLSGEVIAARELLESIPFCSGYAVETAMMIDVLNAVGLDAMAQVDLGVRHNRSQPLFALGTMAYAVVRAVAMRSEIEAARPDGELDSYLHAYCPQDGPRLEQRSVEIVERPPMERFNPRAGRGR